MAVLSTVGVTTLVVFSVLRFRTICRVANFDPSKRHIYSVCVGDSRPQPLSVTEFSLPAARFVSRTGSRVITRLTSSSWMPFYYAIFFQVGHHVDNTHSFTSQIGHHVTNCRIGQHPLTLISDRTPCYIRNAWIGHHVTNTLIGLNTMVQTKHSNRVGYHRTIPSRI